MFIASNFDHCENLYRNWRRRLGDGGDLFGLDIALLQDDSERSTADLEAIQKADIVLATAAKWEMLTRDSLLLDKVSLYVFD